MLPVLAAQRALVRLFSEGAPQVLAGRGHDGSQLPVVVTSARTAIDMGWDGLASVHACMACASVRSRQRADLCVKTFQKQVDGQIGPWSLEVLLVPSRYMLSHGYGLSSYSVTGLALFVCSRTQATLKQVFWCFR